MEKSEVLRNAMDIDPAIDTLDRVAKNLKQSGVKELQRFGYEMSDVSNKVVRAQRTLRQIAEGEAPDLVDNG